LFWTTAYGYAFIDGEEVNASHIYKVAKVKSFDYDLVRLTKI